MSHDLAFRSRAADEHETSSKPESESNPEDSQDRNQAESGKRVSGTPDNIARRVIAKHFARDEKNLGQADAILLQKEIEQAGGPHLGVPALQTRVSRLSVSITVADYRSLLTSDLKETNGRLDRFKQECAP